MNKYQFKKSNARSEAIQYQNNIAAIYGLSWAETIEKHNYFLKLAKRYGLLREFKENGII